MVGYDGSLKFDTKIDESGFQKGTSSLSGSASKAGTIIQKALVAAGAAVAAGIGYAVKVGSDFEAQMSKVGAISGATADQMEALTATAKQLGIDTKFSATEAGQAFEYMAMAGWKTDDMLGGISGIMNLAAASGEDLASVSDIVTDALTAFGLQASDSAQFADVLAAASSNANTNVGMMGETFKYVAPVAGAMRFSIQDTAQAIGLMANAGIKGSQAGTALRSVFTRLSKPPKEAATAMKALNLTITKSDGSFKSLGTIMEDLRGKFAKLTDEQKTQYAAMLGGQEAMSGLLAIVNASQSDYDKLAESIANADGTAQNMADTMNDNLKGKLTLLKSSMEGLGLAIYDVFGNKAKTAVAGLIDVLNAVTNAVQTGDVEALFQTLAEQVRKGLETLSNMIANGKEFSATATVLLNKMMDAVIDALPGLVNRMAEIAGRIAELMDAAGFDFGVLAYNMINKLCDQLVEHAPEIARALIKLIMISSNMTMIVSMGIMRGMISSLIVDAAGQITTLWNTTILPFFTQTIPQTFTSIVTSIGQGIAAAWQTVVTFVTQTIPQTIASIWSTITQSISTGWNAIVTYLQTQISSLINNIIQWFTELPYNIGVIIGEMLKVIVGFGVSAFNAFTALKDNVIQIITEDIPNVFQSFVDWLTDLPSKIGEFVNDIIKTVSELPGKIADKFEEVKNHASDKAEEMIHVIEDKFTQAVNAAWNALSSLPGKVADRLNEVVAKALEFGKNLKSRMDEASDSAKNAVINGLKELPDKMLAIGKNVVEGLWNGITNKIDWIKNKIQWFANEVIRGIKDALGIHSPSRVMRDEVGKMIVLGMANGITENAKEATDAFKKLVDALDYKRKFDLISEAEYYSELQKLTDQYITKGTKEWYDYYQKIYEYNTKVEEEQRKTIEAQKKAITDIYTEMAKEATDKIDEIKQAQNQLADKLKDYGRLYDEVTVSKLDGSGDITMLQTHDIQSDIDALMAYNNALVKLKERGEIPVELFAQIRDMDVDEGTQYVNMLLTMSDDTYKQYIGDWAKKQEVSEEIAKTLYTDETEAMLEDTSENMAKTMVDKLKEKFGDVPDNFFDTGVSAALGFGDGFMAEINAVMDKIREQVAVASAQIIPQIALVGGGTGGVGSSTTYSPTYNLYSSGETTAQQLRAARAQEEVNRLRGGIE